MIASYVMPDRISLVIIIVTLCPKKRTSSHHWLNFISHSLLLLPFYVIQSQAIFRKMSRQSDIIYLFLARFIARQQLAQLWYSSSVRLFIGTDSIAVIGTISPRPTCVATLT